MFEKSRRIRDEEDNILNHRLNGSGILYSDYKSKRGILGYLGVLILKNQSEEKATTSGEIFFPTISIFNSVY